MTAPTPSPPLERLWADIPAGPAPIDDLLLGGRRIRRRRRVVIAVGAAAAVTAVIAGAGLVRTLADGPDRRQTEVLAPAPVAPDGHRLVGVGGVVVAVPEDWLPGNGDHGCLASEGRVTLSDPLTDDGHPVTLVQPTQGICGARGEYSELAAFDLDSVAGELASRVATRERTINGTEVRIGEGRCVDTMFCVDLPRYPTYAVVPSEGIVLRVFGPERDQATLDAVVDSLQVLPEGYTTVPHVVGGMSAATRAVARAGLGVELTTRPCPPTASCVADAVVDSEPSFGAPVRDGSTVTLVTYGP